ncbi:hypothetical protein MNBD_GAMMA06-1685 [hydrothermal vent metagenome]|uniref:Acylphosphatase-like domain-containing protein n=1 Tax=hydrothermal vent metagenome TaxID=652676 RepID=A0A3B0X1V1_9ZZZZ
MRIRPWMGRQIFAPGKICTSTIRGGRITQGGRSRCAYVQDGLVEVIVTGDDVAVQSLIKWLKIGPKHAKVSTIKVIDLSMPYLQDNQKNDFEIWSTQFSTTK